MKEDTLVEAKRQYSRNALLTGGMALFVALALASCSDTPTESNSVGDSLLPTSVNIRDTTVQAIRSSTFRQYIPMDSRANLVGRSGNYLAYTTLQFFSSGIPERDTIQVVSATLKLRLVSWSGDSTGTFAFDVYKITRSWAQETLRWDSVQIGFYETSPVRGTFSGRVQADTEYINVNLDTSMVREWLQPTTVTSYGIILVPTSACTVVRGIHEFGYDSTQYQPTLQVIARNLAGTVTDTIPYRSGGDTFVGNIDNLASDPSLFYLQAGVVYRSTLDFDVSRVPRASLIQSAELLLVWDHTASKVSRFSGDPTVSVHVLTGEDTSTNVELVSTTGKQVSGSDTFSVDLRHAVQYWLKGQNYGVLLRANELYEFSSNDLYAFYNQTAATQAVRPRLKIKYVLQNQ